MIPADPADAPQADSLALCAQITCLLLSRLSEPCGPVDRRQLKQRRRRAALALGLLPSAFA